jgi:hypothetical protein
MQFQEVLRLSHLLMSSKRILDASSASLFSPIDSAPIRGQSYLATSLPHASTVISAFPSKSHHQIESVTQKVKAERYHVILTIKAGQNATPNTWLEVI